MYGRAGKDPHYVSLHFPSSPLRSPCELGMIIGPMQFHIDLYISISVVISLRAYTASGDSISMTSKSVVVDSVMLAADIGC